MNFKNVKSVFAREFKSYFDSPVAYVFLVAFLVLIGFLTFGVAMFYERRQAVLTPFFLWHPWVYLLLVPAATMGLWAEERRNGTIELLLTLPITLGEALIALSVSVPANPAAELAMRKLANLSGCEMHLTLLPSPGDEAGLRRLGINLTCDPLFASSNLFED